MLKEFPAHLFGMEGPQACLLLATVLMGVAFVFPLLDRQRGAGASRARSSRTSAWPGILFLGFLTLKAWDVGVHVPKGRTRRPTPALAAPIARTAAAWILGLGLAATIFRWIRYRHTTLSASRSAALLQAALNGFAGLTWLAAGAVAAVAADPRRR